MFPPLPQPAQLSLDAALRDLSATRLSARALAVKSLAPALLAELGVPDPHLAARRVDRSAERCAQVCAALRTARRDEAPELRALALVGLAQLDAASALEASEAVLRQPDPHPFEAECAALALSIAARSEPPSPALHTRGRASLIHALSASLPQIRYQAAAGLAELEVADLADLLAERLPRETNAEVAAGWLDALLTLEPVPDRAVDAALDRLSAPDPTVAFAAARLLAGARRDEAVPVLIAALRDNERRDDALEALAVLGPAALEHREALARLATRLWIPPITRVRAAYALARVAPDDGETHLTRLAMHWRASVREAVHDARAALAKLDAQPPRENSRSGTAAT